MPLSKTDVIYGYKLILGREPESEDIIKLYLDLNDIYELRNILLKSKEFIKNYAFLSKHNPNILAPLLFGLLTGSMPEKEENYVEISDGDTLKLISHVLKEANALHILSAYDTTTKSLYEDLTREKIIFMHIPKTGGTTVHSLLIQHFRKRDICPERWNGLGKYSLNAIVKYRLFSGHFDFLSCLSIPGLNNKIFTFFRDPVQRLVSLYYFQKAHREKLIKSQNLYLARLANELDIIAFFKHPNVRSHPSINNTYALTLAGRLPQGRWEHEASGLLEEDPCSDPDLLKDAIENLHKLHCFGILEDFDASIIHVFRTLGLPVPSLPIEPRMVLSQITQTDPGLKPVTKEDINDELIDVLHDLTCLDQMIYDYAVSLSKIRMAEAQTQDRIETHSAESVLGDH